MADESRNVFSSSYAAYFAPRTHKFETVDFRVPASRANLQSYFPHSSRESLFRARLAGLLGIAVGLVCALVGFGVDQLTRGLTLGLYISAGKLLQSDRFWPGVVTFVVICLAFVAVAACMVVYIAPLGAGSGIPELKSYLNGVKIPGFLAMNSLFVKTVGICFSLASGLLCGKQGPMIHAGAIIGAGMSQFASSRLSWRWNNKHIRFLRTETWKRDFCAVGAAVGIAVAFGSPMGAWMWVYEEACTHWTWDLGIITLGGCLSGAIVARILNYLAAGLPGGFGVFTLTQFGKLVTPFAGSRFLLKDVPAFVLIGIIGGVCGAILPLVNKRITLFRYSKVTKPVPRILEALLIAFLTAVVRIIVPYLANDCQPVDAGMQAVLESAPLGDHSRFNCAESEFSPWAAVIYNPTDSVVRALLYTRGPGLFPAGAVAVAFVYYFVFIIWTYGIAVPAGVFFPAFLLGSVYGRLIGIAVQAIFPGRTDVSLTAYAFIGTISALAGLTRTISVAVIALEATGGNDASFAAVLVAIVAKLVGDFLYSRGIYDLHIDLKGIPFLGSEVPHLEEYQKLRVSDVMESSVIGVRRLSRVYGLVHMLGTNDHHAFPVFVKLLSSESEEFRSSLDANEDEDHLSRSETSILEAELDGEDTEDDGPKTSRIITPSQHGMQATIFDEGVKRIVQLTERGEVKVVAAVTPRSHQGSRKVTFRTDSTDSTASPSGADTSGGVSNEIPDFELMGSIDRGTLLALLKHECDREERGRSAQAGIESDVGVCRDEVSREDLDAAWPNPARLKGNGESELIRRAHELGILDRVIDLKRYIDPDPLLMSDRALSMAAYKLFRGTGARHILVTNMRSGRVCGIMTRKDILPSSIKEVLAKLKGVKVE